MDLRKGSDMLLLVTEVPVPSAASRLYIGKGEKSAQLAKHDVTRCRLRVAPGAGNTRSGFKKVQFKWDILRDGRGFLQPC